VNAGLGSDTEDSVILILHPTGELFFITNSLLQVFPTIIFPKLISFSAHVMNAYFPIPFNLINFCFSSFICIVVVANNNLASCAIKPIFIFILLLAFIVPVSGYILNSSFFTG